MDPPNTPLHYGATDHVLETLARYDKPSLVGKSGLRKDLCINSDFCSKKHVKSAFKYLIENVTSPFIFLNYNNEGLLTLDFIRDIMSQKGNYGVFCKKHTQYKSATSKSKNVKSKTTLEYLHYIVCK